MIGFDKLFYRFILKDWIDSKENCSKYTLHNAVIVKEYMKYYADCWKQRYRAYDNLEYQREILVKWCKGVRDSFINRVDCQLRNYIINYSLNTDHAMIKYITE